MKQFKGKLINSLILFLVGAFLLTACSFGVPLTLRAPVIEDEEEITSVSWYQNEKAESFDVYINNSVVKNIPQDDNVSVYTFDYSTYTVEDGSYTIKVKAIGDGKNYKNSRFSNSVIIYVGENITGGYDTSSLSIVRNSALAPSSLEYISEGQSIRWDNKQKDGINAEKYIVQIYCNEYTDSTDNRDKIRSFYVTQNYFVLSDYLKGNEVLAISVGSKFTDDENIYVSDIYFHNPLNMGDYSEVYVFDGGVYDYYIEDYEELQNLYYYAYISRSINLNFMVSNSFYNSHTEDYFNMNQYTYGQYRPYIHQQYIIGLSDSYDKWAYYETYDFSIAPYLQEIDTDNLNGHEFCLRAGYTHDQPELKSSDGKYTGLSEKLLAQVSLEEPYYEKVDYAPREDSYNNFTSDKNVLTTYCDSSEELYWAVENNVTPLFKSSTSRASLVYKEAKNLLIDIISDEMNDYEKVLSIFDWLATNTCYDNYAYSTGASTNNTCYYLEGVFLDSNRVAVCDGFSKAFSLLCNMEGIDCYRVMGMASGGSTAGGHAWNKVAVNGSWYVVDITWTEIKQNEVETDNDGNIIYTVEDVTYYGYVKKPIIEQVEEYNCHNYFLVSDDYISNTHTPFAQREKVNNASLPAYKMYGYYTSPTFMYNGSSYSRVVDSNADMEAVLNYIYQNNVQNFEVIFDENYVSTFGYDITSVLQNGRGNNLFMGISIEGALIRTSSTLYSIETEYIKKNDVTYACDYEIKLQQGYVSIVYAQNAYTLKAGYVLYLTCETNILNVAPENLTQDNRYTQFVDYLVKNGLEFDGKISFEDAFLSEVLGLDLNSSTYEEIEEALAAFILNDLNTNAGSTLYQSISLKFDKTEKVSSNVYNGTTFEEKEYNAYVFDVDIKFE